MNSGLKAKSPIGTNMKTSVLMEDLGLIDYKEAWDKQQAIFDHAVRRKIDLKKDVTLSQPESHLILCEHPPVYTLGKSGSENNLLLHEQQLSAKAISFYRNNRGGDITFHGPGQLVGYPILDLEQINLGKEPDIKAYMHALEEVIIRTVAEYGLTGERIEGAVGIWLDKDIPHKTRKICAFGVKTSRWITMHGWALNVNTDLHYFDFIIPCGIADKGVTSLQKELGCPIDMEEVTGKIIANFSEVFDVEITRLAN